MNIPTIADPVPANLERRRTSVAAAVVVLLVVSNVMSNRVIPAWMYVPWNLAIAAACLAMAFTVATPPRLGLTNWRVGVRWGLVLLGLTIVVLLAVVAVPAGRDIFRDTRAQSSVGALLYHALLRIPFGTVLLEELAFRGVLPGLFSLRWGLVRSSVYASILFGLWHVLPSLGLDDRNRSAAQAFGHGPSGTIAIVVFAVVGTTLAGLAWCWLRYRTGSVATTVLAHIATNSVAFTIAWFIR